MQKCYASIVGTGAWVPETVLSNSDLEKMLDTNSEWIIERTGIAERRILSEEGKGVSFMAVNAVKDLLNNTGCSPKDIEVLILTTVNSDYKFPSSASLVCRDAGLTNAYGFDINATCSGFIYALEIARRYIESGAYKNIIVVSTEKMSSVTDYADRSSSILFGDGAAAVLLQSSQKNGIIDILLKTDGQGAMNIIAKDGGSANPITAESLTQGGQYFKQEGKVVFKHAVVGMETACRDILMRNGLETSAIQWVIAHQANMRIIESVAQRLGIPMEKMLVNIQKYGNTSSASIPLCLHDYRNSIKPGDKLLFTAFGAGYTWGAVLMTWGK